MSESLTPLLDAARLAARNAYCPYSGFRVGAAIQSTDGQVFAGCNVENLSFGLTLCAERSAVSQMIAAGQQEIAAVVVYTEAETPTTPCGACRQVLREFGDQVRVLCVTADGQQLDTTLDELLPHSVVISSIERKPRGNQEHD